MARPAGHKLNRDAWQDILDLKGLNLTGVAEMSNVARATLSSLLGGHHAASVPVAHRIAEAVGCRPATLFPTLTPSQKEEAA